MSGCGAAGPSEIEVCDEGEYCGVHLAEALLEHAWMAGASQGAVTGRLSDDDVHELRTAGRGHLVADR